MTKPLMLSVAMLLASAHAYVGHPIHATRLLCESTNAVSAGYFRKGIDVVRDVNVNPAEPTQQWMIQINGNKAIVTDPSAKPVQFDEVTNFVVERAHGAWQLVQEHRQFGTSPETITIDPTNGSFVYVDQHADGLWNLANIFLGSCHDEAAQ